MLRINNTLAILLILLTGALANPLRRRGVRAFPPVVIVPFMNNKP